MSIKGISIETENRLMVLGLEREENGERLLMGIGFFGSDEDVLNLHCGDVCTTV